MMKRFLSVLTSILFAAPALAVPGDGIDSEARAVNPGIATYYVCSEPLQESQQPDASLWDPPSSGSLECRPENGKVIDQLNIGELTFVTQQSLVDNQYGDKLGNAPYALAAYGARGQVYGFNYGGLYNLTNRTFCLRGYEMLPNGYLYPDNAHEVSPGNAEKWKGPRFGSAYAGPGGPNHECWTPGYQTGSGVGCVGGPKNLNPNCYYEQAFGYVTDGCWWEVGIVGGGDPRWVGDGALKLTELEGHWVRLEWCVDHFTAPGPLQNKMQSRFRWHRVDVDRGGEISVIHPGTHNENWLDYSGGGGDNHMINPTTPDYDPGLPRYFAYNMIVVTDTVDPTYWIGPAAEVEIAQSVVTVNLQTDTAAITSGSSATLSWTTTGSPASCVGSANPAYPTWSIARPSAGSFPVSPTETTIFTLTCDGVPDSVEVVVVGTVGLGASKTTVVSGTPTTIFAEFTGPPPATCTGSSNPAYGAPWDGAQPTSTFQVDVSPTVNTTFYLDCTAMPQASVGVATVPPVIVTVLVNPPTIAAGGSSTLSWSATGSPTGCRQLFGDALPPSGSLPITTLPGRPAGGQTFWITCANQYGLGYNVATLTITPTTTATLAASPQVIKKGESSRLIWTSAYAQSCAGTGFSTGSLANGSLFVAPTTTTQYSINCTGLGGVVSPDQTVTVTVEGVVDPPPPPPLPPPPNIPHLIGEAGSGPIRGKSTAHAIKGGHF